MLKANLAEFKSLHEANVSEFDLSINEMIMELVEAQEVLGLDTSSESGGWSRENMSPFVDFTKSNDHLPIPVTTNSTPFNPHHFLMHVILSLGKYDT